MELGRPRDLLDLLGEPFPILQRLQIVGRLHLQPAAEVGENVGAELVRVLGDALLVQLGRLGVEDHAAGLAQLLPAGELDRRKPGCHKPPGFLRLAVEVVEPARRRGQPVLAAQLPGHDAVQPGHQLKRPGSTPHVPRERPHRVQRAAEGDDSFGAHHPQGGLDADAAAEAGRDPDRAAGVGPDRPVAHSGNHGCCRAAGGAAGDSLGVGRVAHRPVVRVVAGDAERPLVQVGLADDDAAVPAELADQDRVGVCRLAREQHGARGGDRSAHVDQVLDRHHRSVAGLLRQ